MCMCVSLCVYLCVCALGYTHGTMCKQSTEDGLLVQVFSLQHFGPSGSNSTCQLTRFGSRHLYPLIHLTTMSWVFILPDVLQSDVINFFPSTLTLPLIALKILYISFKIRSETLASMYHSFVMTQYYGPGSCLSFMLDSVPAKVSFCCS